MNFALIEREVREASAALAGSLGLDRESLPQIPGDRLDHFMQWSKDKGVTWSPREVPTQALRPIQGEVKKEKVAALSKNPDALRKRIMVSADNAIIDGHHRWVARKLALPGTATPAFVANLTLMKLLAVMRSYPFAEFRTVESQQASFVQEGLFDPFILKAVFMAGGPGSGKSFISSAMFSGMGLRVSNSDDILSALAAQAGVNLKTDLMTPAGQSIRASAKTLNDKRLSLYMAAKLGVIIDSTGDDPQKIMASRSKLIAAGYDCGMVFVSTDLDTALARNASRDRVVGADIVRAKWTDSMKARDAYRGTFGDKFIEIDNSGTKQVSDIIGPMTRAAMKLLGRSVSNPIGQKWIADQTKGSAALGRLVWTRESDGEPPVTQEGYCYAQVCRPDIVRGLTNWGFTRRRATRLMRSVGPHGIREVLKTNLRSQPEAIGKQWRHLLHMLDRLIVQEAEKETARG